MPFDISTETPAIRRAALIDRLRNDTAWPWNFCTTPGCAIGMARTMWPVGLNEVLGLTSRQYEDIFGLIDFRENEQRGLDPEWCPFYGMLRNQVTPAMVADALERVDA